VNVLMISPGYPGTMPAFTRALAQVGARVFGVGDQPEAWLPIGVRDALVAHLHVPDLWDDRDVVGRVVAEAGSAGVRFDRVECLWEPAMLLAARLREALGVPGLGVEQTIAFRDKDRMKAVLDAAGVRTPRHARARTADVVRLASRELGFPLIVKPIAGAGAVNTHRVDSAEALEAILPSLRGVDEVSVEEFIEGDELTFDTICANGRILYENVAVYRTRPIEEKKHQWVSPCAVCLRDLDVDALGGGRELGRAVLDAMGFRTGFTHMEWFRKRDGEVVFCEIAARPPGVRLVDAMNFASDIDLYRGWAEAVCTGRISQSTERRYNTGMVAKRAQGAGRVRRIEGLERLVAEFGSCIAGMEMPELGAVAGNWRAAAPADGWVIVRHPDLEETYRLTDRVLRELEILAG